MTVASKRDRGRAKQTGAKRQSRGQHPDRGSTLTSGIRQLLEREIDFIPNRCFLEPDAEATILGQRADVHAPFPRVSWQRDMPAHLARLCEAELLSAEAEADLFRQMNYFKFRANVLRSELNPDQPHAETYRAAERNVAQANVIRERIIRANLRLVMSIVKKYAGPQYPFDDLLSEGMLSLMHAVDKFDYSRGFRFSTYAYRAIARTAYRAVRTYHQERSRFAAGGEEIHLDTIGQPEDEGLGEQTWMRLRARLTGLLDQLDRREQFIIRARFALGAHRKVRTFQSLANRLDISKERVRQLAQRAVEKLQAMANAPPPTTTGRTAAERPPTRRATAP